MSNAVWVVEDSVWVNDHNKPNVLLFARNYEDKYVTNTFVATGFRPYFYIPADSSPIVYTNAQIGIREVEARVYTDALGRPIRRCIVGLPSDVPQMRDNYAFTCEADIPFDKRFLIDNRIGYAFTEADGVFEPYQVTQPCLPRVMYFDVEVKGDGIHVPKPDTVDWPLVSIQCMDSYTKDITVFTYGVPQVADDQVACKTEQEMLRAFANYVTKLNPDLLSGWYTNTYDLPYIIQRAFKLNVQIKGICRTQRSPYARQVGKDWQIRVPGRQCLDMLVAFKKYYAPQGGLDAYDLKSVVANKGVIGDRAFSYTDYGDKIVRLFEAQEWDTFLQYCRNDVIALDIIDNGLKLIEFYEYLRMIAGVKIEETMMNSRVIESLLMRNGIKPMPTKNYAIQDKESFEGAIVLSPPAGIHNNAGVIDLAALYPNIIVGFNVSPDVDGVVPHVIKTVMEEREKLRALKLAGKADDVTKNKEVVLKYLANSFYGVIGWDRFRLYNKEQAAFVTKTGRELNVYLQEVAHARGYEVIYGDTDSVIFKEISSTDIGIEFQNYCNEKLAEWSKAHGSSVNFTLKFEKLYRRLMFKMAITGAVAKKRYAGHLIWKDGFAVDKIDMTGIELKRSDQSVITKRVLKEFLDNILLKDDVDEAIQKVKQVIGDIKGGKVSIHDVSIPRGLHGDKDNPWTRGIYNLDKHLNITIPDGIKPRLIYCKGPFTELCIYPDIDENIILNAVEIDWNMICDKTIVKKMQTYIESAGRNWDVCINGQTSLFDY